VIDLRKELRAILPNDHPILKKLDQEPEIPVIEDPEPRSDPYLRHLVARLVDTIDDWKRGIRDWAEVERELGTVRDEIKE
jgi:hypothetical protein